MDGPLKLRRQQAMHQPLARQTSQTREGRGFNGDVEMALAGVAGARVAGMQRRLIGDDETRRAETRGEDVAHRLGDLAHPKIKAHQFRRVNS